MSFDRGKILSRLEPALKPFEENLDIAEMALLLASLDLPNEDLAPFPKNLNQNFVGLGCCNEKCASHPGLGYCSL